MIKPEYIHSDITGKIFSVAFEVHSYLGAGFIENVYHRAMLIECVNRNLSCESEKQLDIFYKSQKVGARRADLLFDNKVIVEIKAVSKLEDVHLAQAINYHEAFKLEVGLLLNFGSKSLEYKRFVHPSILKNKSVRSD